jgi:Flp pilus assembly protein TadD
VIAYIQQRFDKATEYFQKVITEHDYESFEDKKPFAVSYYLLGKIALAINKPDKAIRYFHLATKVQPNDPAIYNDLGIAYMRNREIENAKQSFQKALEIDPNYRIAKKNLEIAEAE